VTLVASWTLSLTSQRKAPSFVAALVVRRKLCFVWCFSMFLSCVLLGVGALLRYKLDFYDPNDAGVSSDDDSSFI
jgi:hypothetical protein